jgi:hypothetical protein
MVVDGGRSVASPTVGQEGSTTENRFLLTGDHLQAREKLCRQRGLALWGISALV